MRILITHQAKERLESIYEYYLALGYRRYGRQVQAAILKKTLLLKDFPFVGQEEETLKVLGLNYRYLVEGHYKIVYRVENETIYIIDIFDTRQDPDKMIED